MVVYLSSPSDHGSLYFLKHYLSFSVPFHISLLKGSTSVLYTSVQFFPSVNQLIILTVALSGNTVHAKVTNCIQYSLVTRVGLRVSVHGSCIGLRISTVIFFIAECDMYVAIADPSTPG